MKTSIVCYDAELVFPFAKEVYTIPVKRTVNMLIGIQWPGVDISIEDILPKAIALQQEDNPQATYTDISIDSNGAIYANFSITENREVILYDVADITEFYRLYGNDVVVNVRYDYFERHFATEISFEDGR